VTAGTQWAELGLTLSSSQQGIDNEVLHRTFSRLWSLPSSVLW